MDTLVARRAQRTTDRTANAPTSPYDSGSNDFYEFSATVNFASTASGAASAAVDVAAPSGVTLPVGNPVQVGVPGALEAGMLVTGKVKTGGAYVTLQAMNLSGSTVDAASGTYTIRVRR